MTAPPGPTLTPELALAYVRELSADVRAGVVLDGAGALLAGPPGVAASARALLAADPHARELAVVLPAGVVCAARCAAYAVVVAAGPFALPGVLRGDLRTAVAALEGAAPTAAADLLARTAPPRVMRAPPRTG